MGNDGGDIPGRKQLVKDRTKIQIPDPQAVAIGRARYCNLTKQKLSLPMAMCRLGYIFNYQCILEALLTKSLPKKYQYIKKLSGIRQIYPEIIKYESQNVILCSISKLQYNGFNKFVGLWTCGHVFSLKAINQIQNDKKCLTCDKPYTKEDLVDLNMDPAQQQKLKNYIISKNQKKSQKKNNEQQEEKEKEKDKITKKVHTEIHLNKLQQLDGDITDIIRSRENFKGLFHKQYKVQGDLFVRNTKVGLR